MWLVDVFLKFSIALFGAAAGATAAYLFQRHKAEEEREQERYESAIRALYVLIARMSTLENFRSAYLTEDQTMIREEHSMEIIQIFTHKTPIDLPSLSFMADRDDGQLLHDFSVNESNYFNFVEAIEERNRDVRQFYSSSIVENIDMDTGKVTSRSKPQDFKLVVDQTRNLAKAASKSIAATNTEIKSLGECTRRRFGPRFVPNPKLIDDPSKK
jgi:hypothetical protein